MPNSRILGLDVARATAIGGMALIHFAMVLSSTEFDTRLGSLIDRLAGRPAAAFMILAGIGVALQLRRSVNQTRRRLWSRGLFFLAAGYMNLLLWPGDILRVYGVAYLVAIFFVMARDRKLWAAVAFVVFLFVSLVFSIDFETNWDFKTLHYANLWTPNGAFLNLFYNGFRAVLPWLALFFLGMIIGRRDLRSNIVQKKLMGLGILLWGSAEAISFAIRQRLSTVEGFDPETITALFGTDSLPPMPLFLLSSSGLAILGIAACIFFVDRKPISTWAMPLASAGQMAFTWYIGHIVIVIVAGMLTGFRGDVSMRLTFGVSALFFATMIATSHFYHHYFRLGPLEWFLRFVAK